MSYIRKRLKGIEDCFKIDSGINVPFFLHQISIKNKNETYLTSVSMKRLGYSFAVKFFKEGSVRAETEWL